MKFPYSVIFGSVLLLIGCGSDISVLNSAESNIDQQSFSPARFNYSSDYLANNIDFPEISGDIDLSITCSTRVSRIGVLRSRLVCYDYKDQFADFFYAIYYFFGSESVEPAKINGRNVSLDKFYFTVNFRSVNTTKEIKVYENMGIQTDNNNPDSNYISPQRYRTSGELQCIRSFGQDFVSFVFIVDTSGLAKDIFSPAEDLMSTTCFESIKRTIERSRYIPGQLDQSPIEAIHVQTYASMRNIGSNFSRARDVNSLPRNFRIQNGVCDNDTRVRVDYCFIARPLILM